MFHGQFFSILVKQHAVLNMYCDMTFTLMLSVQYHDPIGLRKTSILVSFVAKQMGMRPSQ